MWSINRDQGNEWYLVRVPMNNVDISYDYKIIFEGKTFLNKRKNIF